MMTVSTIHHIHYSAAGFSKRVADIPSTALEPMQREARRRLKLVWEPPHAQQLSFFFVGG